MGFSLAAIGGVLVLALGIFLLFVVLLTIGIEVAAGLQTGDDVVAVFIVLQVLIVLGTLTFLRLALKQPDN